MKKQSFWNNYGVHVVEVAILSGLFVLMLLIICSMQQPKDNIQNDLIKEAQQTAIQNMESRGI